jgi:hypothetical protein
VSDRHGDIVGTLPMSLVNIEPKVAGRAPDIIVSFNYDETIAVAGKPGISYASSVNRRGDHGSFTRISLLLRGPDFKTGHYDTLPTANVDIAPTVAHILCRTRRGACWRRRCREARWSPTSVCIARRSGLRPEPA